MGKADAAVDFAIEPFRLRLLWSPSEMVAIHRQRAIGIRGDMSAFALSTPASRTHAVATPYHHPSDIFLYHTVMFELSSQLKSKYERAGTAKHGQSHPSIDRYDWPPLSAAE